MLSSNFAFAFQQERRGIQSRGPGRKRKTGLEDSTVTKMTPGLMLYQKETH